MYSCLLLAEKDFNVRLLEDELDKEKIAVVFSDPSYTNYLKTIQYLPDIIIVKIPARYSNELNYLQMVKQHNIVSAIPIVCFGQRLPDQILQGLLKIGIHRYFEVPLDLPAFIESIMPLFGREKILPAIQKKGSMQGDLKESMEEGHILLNNKIPSEKKIELVCGHIDKLLAFPYSISKLLKISASDDSCAAQMARIIESDPVLSAKVLKMSNSAFWGGGKRKISTIRDAVVRLGIIETRRMALSTSVMWLFDPADEIPGFNRLNFWYHCLATAVIAEILADRLPGCDRDEMFLCGLLHDFGLILLNEFYPEIFSQIMKIVTDSGSHFLEKEQQLIGITHSEVVRALFARWEIPSSIIEVVTGYGSLPETMPDGEGADSRLAAGGIALANNLSKAMMLGVGCDMFVKPLPKWVSDLFKCHGGLSAADRDAINAAMEEYRELMNMPKDQLMKPNIADKEEKKVNLGFYCGTRRFSVTYEYCVSRGHSVNWIDLPDDKGTYHGRFDAIIVESDNDIHADQIRKLEGIRRRKPLSGDENAPLLYIIPLNPSPEILTLARGNPYLPDSFDLRQIDLCLGLITMPWKSPISPVCNKRSAADSVEQVLSDIEHFPRQYRPMIADLLSLRVECMEKGIVGVLLNDADLALGKLVNELRENSCDFERGSRAVSAVSLSFKQALLKHQLSLIDAALERLGEEKK